MPSNGKSNESSLHPPEQGGVLLDAWREALDLSLAEILAKQQREWTRERELIEAQARMAIAELRAQIIEMRADFAAQIKARLVELRDGRDGAAGPAGERGERGEKGEKGDAGPIGLQGPQGASGADGQDGPAGPQGAQGEPGLPGQRGEKGEPGLAGAQGPAGEPGAAGKDGERGPAGEPGREGAAGAPGESGAQGARGDRGEAGPPGSVGERGPAGLRGETGPVGARGFDGAPGKLPAVKVWSDGVHFESEVVAHAGATWQALKATGREPPHEDWICLARAGCDGRALIFRGTFEAEAKYSRLDVVALNGASFVALRDEPGACPGDGWQLMVRQGQRGIAGPRGEKGERGERGANGANALVLKSWKIDRRQYTATPVMSDGSEGPSIELRALFKQFQDETDG